MKDLFSGFYLNSEDEINRAWNSPKTLFAFDTNTLLNLYSYAEQTREDFYSVLRAIQERVWIPHQVALEYQRRRLDVIKEEKAIFSKIEELLKKIDDLFEKDFSNLALSRRFPPLNKSTEKLHSDIKRLTTNYKKSLMHWDKKQPCVRSADPIREKLDLIFSEKVGKEPTQEQLDEIYKEGIERYKNKVPPGYKDKNKANEQDATFNFSGLLFQRQFGDLILWKQLIEKAKDNEIESIFFVTDDAKEDWWEIKNSRGEKKIGPQPYLKEEIHKESKIEIFAMYSTAEFLTTASELLNLEINKDSVSDAKESFKPNTQTDYQKAIRSFLSYKLNSSRSDQVKRDPAWEGFARGKLEEDFYARYLRSILKANNKNDFDDFIKTEHRTPSSELLTGDWNNNIDEINDDIKRIILTTNIKSLEEDDD